MATKPDLTPKHVDHQVQQLEHALTYEVVRAVEKHIKDQVQPIVNKMVKELAGEAVKNWSFQYKAQQRADYDMTTEISIRFVENIIKTVMKENDIKIEVVK